MAMAQPRAAMSGREQRAAITKGMNAFGFALYPRLREGAGNVCYSPASLAFVLTMGYAGARGGTAREMAAVLHLPQVAPEQGWGIEETLTHLAIKAGLPPEAWRESAEFLVFEAQVIREKAGADKSQR